MDISEKLESIRRDVAELQYSLDHPVPEDVHKLIDYAIENKKSLRWCFTEKALDKFEEACSWMGTYLQGEVYGAIARNQDEFARLWVEKKKKHEQSI